VTRFATCLLALCFALPAAAAVPLTLAEVLAFADTAHPDLDLARAEAELAGAEAALADSQNDLRLTLLGGLRGGRNTLARDDFSGDSYARLNLRKMLWDSGRSDSAQAAARFEQAGREQLLRHARAQRRLTLLARYFDVLTADLRYVADNEVMTVAWLDWDKHRERHALGEVSNVVIAGLAARYETLRAQRNDALRRAREKRELLAAAMNRPGELVAELAEPDLTAYARPLPDFERLYQHLLAHNPRLIAQRQRLAAASQRLDGLRAEYRPSLEFEAEAAAYDRATSSRDELLAGVNLVWPLSQGRRVDARLARERAQTQLLQAELDRLQLDLRERLQALRDEIEALRHDERRAAAEEVAYRDWQMERARAEYELELKTNLGSSLAETQLARLRQRAIETRHALAWERLAALLGGSVADLPGAGG